MFATLESVAWDLEVQPEWNAPGAVPNALRKLATCTSSTESAAYNAMLYALGNNHAGTYFPVVLRAVPFFGEILQTCGEAPRICTLDILLDLAASFAPDPANAMVDGELLEQLLATEIAKLTDVIERLATSTTNEKERELAAEMLEHVRGAP